MAGQDLHNNIKVTNAINPVSPAATGTITGDNIIDRANFSELEFVIQAGEQTTTSITVTPVVMSGDATGSLTSAADSELLGTESGAALDGTAGSDSNSRIGYVGSSRYVRVDLAVANAATGVYSAVAVQSGARKAPTS